MSRLITDHTFEPYNFGPLVICIHLQGGGVCGKSESEHELTEKPSPELPADI